MPNLLSETPVQYGRINLLKLIEKLAKANPSGKWSRQIERMNCDKEGNVLCRDMPYMHVETFKLDGIPVIEFERTGRGTFARDIRKKGEE